MSVTEVKVGDYGCSIESATSTQIVCLIPDTSAVIKINNQGVHPSKCYILYSKNKKLKFVYETYNSGIKMKDKKKCLILSLLVYELIIAIFYIFYFNIFIYLCWCIVPISVNLK